MKKKISAICMAVALSMSAMPMTQAATLSEFVGILADETVNVGADMSLGQNPVSTYENTLVIRDSAEAAIKVDYQTLIKMDEVLKQIGLYEAAANVFAVSAAEIATATVSGEFVVTINYPTNGMNIPESIKTATNMAGFASVDSAKNLNAIFTEKSRDASQAGKIIITIGVENIGLQTLKDNLGDMTFTCTDVEITKHGTYTVVGEVEGKTTISCPAGVLRNVTYKFNQIDELADPENYGKISATVKYTGKSGGGSLGGGTVATDTDYTLTIVVGDDQENIETEYDKNEVVDVDDIQKPTRPGYKFGGFYYDSAFTEAVGETITMNKDMKIYVQWIEVGTNILEMEKHYAYIIGYPTNDGSEIVKPASNITREEIATVFYRLIKPEPRNVLYATTNDFDDVEADRWSNVEISTVANGGYVVGYDDGLFRPAAAITRAEFVTIASRFFGAGDTIEGTDRFSDVSGHWAENYINFAVEKEWINGFEDGTFKPDDYITRAQVMRIINNMLNRHVDAEGLIETAKTWDDNSPNEWYYFDVIEATNAHIYDRAEGETVEAWVEVVENDILANKIDPEKVQVEVEVEVTEEVTESIEVTEEAEATEAVEETTEGAEEGADAAEQTTEEVTEETEAVEETTETTEESDTANAE